MSPSTECDVLVVGGGNAGYSAAVTAAQAGVGKVLLIDACPEEWAGGNSYFTAGAFRTCHSGLEDLLPLVNNVDASKAKLIDLDPYRIEDFERDLARVTAGRYDRRLGKILIGDSKDALKWLSKCGIRFQLSFNRQAYEVVGRYRFWGGMAIMTEDGGKGLMEDHKQNARNHAVEVRYSTPAKRLVMDPNTKRVTGLIVDSDEGPQEIKAKAIILTAGGFEANPRMRAQYLGPGWDLAYVRGTPYNTGHCLEMAMRDASAAPAGNWSGCHATTWDFNAPTERGDREVSNEFTKSGYPLGIMVNNAGHRFVDEGLDMRNFTYAKFGKAVLAQPDGIAFQIWDSQAIPWLRDEEYRPERVERINASTIEELGDKLASLGLQSPATFLETVHEYNEAVHAFRQEHPNAKWDPSQKDGLSTQSTGTRLALGKTNWALPLDQGPFMAVKITTGVTFTFGGLAVNPETAQVLSTYHEEIPGLYCAGEMLGGLFFGNYPGGSGLTAGTVFGRRAGKAAAAGIRVMQ